MIITSPNQLPEIKNSWYVFLAGSIQGAPEWTTLMKHSKLNKPIASCEVEEFLLSHEPTFGLKMKSLSDKPWLLFGHIHGRQKVKKFGIDVGVDCNNFAPVSIDEVRFYTNAIEKGYYDEDV